MTAVLVVIVKVSRYEDGTFWWRKKRKIRKQAHFWCSNVFYNFWCYFTSIPSKTIPPPSTASDNNLYSFMSVIKLCKVYVEVFTATEIYSERMSSIRQLGEYLKSENLTTSAKDDNVFLQILALSIIRS